MITEVIPNDAEWTIWAARLGIVAVVGYIWRNEAKQYRQDMALLKLEKELRETLTHNNDFKELKQTVESIDRLVRKIAIKQGISTREDD